MTDIFISYAREDRPRIEPLAKSLENMGWSVFWDRTIPAGKAWRQVIGDALKNARMVIVAWSQESIKSEWVIEEADRGRVRNILIPILIDDVNPPLGFGAIQAADLTSWDPAHLSPEFEKLIDDISIILGPSPRHLKDAEREAERKRKRKQEEEQEKVEEERKRKEIEAKRKAEEERKRKEVDLEAERAKNAQVERKVEPPKTESKEPLQAEAPIDETKLEETKPAEPKPGITKPPRKSPAAKIGVVIALAAVLVAVSILLLRQEPQVATKPSETSPQKTFTNSIGIEFVLMPAGNFIMGSGLTPEEVVQKYGGKEELFQNEHPRHNVKISMPFYMQTTEVTVGQWRKFIKETGYKTEAETGGRAYALDGSEPKIKKGTYWDNPGFSQDDRQPLTCVSWNDVLEFIQWLNQKEGTDKYRLPTEAEWEYVSRAGSATIFSFGDDASKLIEYAWYIGNSGKRTHLVAQKKDNKWGLYDMHGNVGEWVEDDYHDTYDGAPADGSAWIEKNRGTQRVVRSGGWFSEAHRCRAAARGRLAPANCFTGIGFRLARSVSPGS